MARGKFAKAEGLHRAVLERWVKYLEKAQKDKPGEFTKWKELLARQDRQRNLATNGTTWLKPGR